MLTINSIKVFISLAIPAAATKNVITGVLTESLHTSAQLQSTRVTMALLSMRMVINHVRTASSLQEFVDALTVVLNFGANNVI